MFSVPAAVHDAELGVDEKLLFVRGHRQVGDDDVQRVLPERVLHVHYAL